MQTTEQFNMGVRAAWGKPSAVAKEALDELFRHADEVGLDGDDQVDHALQIGLLAGEMKDGTCDEFIDAFTTKVLNGE